MLSAIGSALNLTSPPRRDDLKEDIEKLDRKLRRIQATVEEVENSEIHDEAVNLWLHELKCLADDAKDVLDEYRYEILRCQLEVKPVETAILPGQVTRSKSNNAIMKYVLSYLSETISLEISEKIYQINSRFDEISGDREVLRLTNEEGMRRVGVSSINLSSTSHLMSKDGIFGRSHDKEEIINLLLSGVLEDDEIKYQFRVIPILGMGGIGKTTVAQMVYNDPFVQSIFDVKAWVYVSSEFDIIRLTKEITECVTGKHGNSFGGFSKNQEVLLKELVGKRMFLVLDDVWDVTQDDWETFFLPLRVAKVVRVLATSRNEAVTEAPSTVSPYRLYLLPEQDCFKLFYHYAFGGEEMKEGEWSLDINKEIIKRCGRLPLAIKCIARVLKYNKKIYIWREILNSELWESDELDPIFRSLKISYYHLPPKLRDCFLFCSLFPKGSRLRKISIIYMWMAHGFVLPKGRKSAEDIGKEYLAELQLRSFIEPCTKGSFRLHDVIYDLGRYLSGGEIHTIMDERSGQIPEKIRHLYIKKGNNSYQSFRPERLRTLFNAPLSTHGSFIDLHDIWSVRVLGLIGSNVLALAHSPLKHLCYLKIIEFMDETLPESLFLLYNLQTLEITRCPNLRELPTNIANLVNLRYLHITHVEIEELPVMLWQVQNLQMLRLRECNNLRVLPLGISNLKNLHVLQLKSCKRLEELPADIGNLINLSLLDVSFSRIRAFPASIAMLKSAKIVLVGVPDNVKKQLTSNSVDVYVELMENGFNRLSFEDKQTAIAQLLQYTSKWDQKLAYFEDIDSVSRITWMSSQNQSLEDYDCLSVNGK
ncbi:hypothetical protein LUZ63_000457 [Rhynchospora breviuscula]|uniref:Uncharacterized protein n=1 Tax=Rhynchospora breviuscula TaxID=2022672 RepID=A0A9Q0HWW1_9POAL|nr:hypothetical protein LUZ63_000457 [Rhynchospora breviuscula]